ncbi:zinc finger BED domain-containing protein RICESLEEPER 1-like [Bidens hawaiensis]|uniref:zinc finger BED domain-containing protein RICESLEEPER 1-like n=1 Tax=Bidens hawaiensis TaxID=980011 RepID=UPI0040499C94
MPTRWNSTFDMLDRAEKFEKAFQAFDLTHPSFKNDLGDGFPKITYWSYARKIRDLLGLFKIKTTNASATKHVTINMFYSEIMDIYRHLRKMRDTDIQSKLMADKMQEKFDKYWGTSNKGFNYILYFAAILDPRLKLRVLSFGYAEVFRAEKRNETDEQLKKRIETAVTFITDELEIVFKHYEDKLNRERPSSSQASQRVSKVAGSTDGSSSYFAQFKSAGGSSSYETKKELQKYLDDIEEPDYEGFDILQWWKVSSSKIR